MRIFPTRNLCDINHINGSIRRLNAVNVCLDAFSEYSCGRSTFIGKLLEKAGRKASGLRAITQQEVTAYDSGAAIFWVHEEPAR